MKVETLIEDYICYLSPGLAEPQQGGLPMLKDGARCLREQWWLPVVILLNFVAFCCKYLPAFFTFSAKIKKNSRKVYKKQNIS